MDHQPERTEQERLLTLIRKVPMFTTSHISSLMDSISPRKKALKYLKKLEQKKLLESSRLPSIEKVYRLTSKGKEQYKVQSRIPSLKSIKTEHYLSLTDTFIELGLPKLFKWELREKYGDKVYSPDILTVIGRELCIIEVQLSPISRDRWAKKWAQANTYFNNGHYESASWQRLAKSGAALLPQFIAISGSDPAIVREGFKVQSRELTVVKDASHLV